jgi:branched-chain amino acid transport system ATP-binding protein
VLELDQLSLAYGPVRAVESLSLTVARGEVVTLIGANGAGKTTTLRAISRLMPIAGGRIRFEGRDLAKEPPDRVVRRGIAHCPEGRQVLARLSVRDNLELGAFVRRDRAVVGEDLERMFALFPILRQRSRQLAGTLSGGEQQMLAIARALMSRPRLLLLDEPSLGLAPIMVEEIFSIIGRLRQEQVTILLVEQNAHLALQAADRAYVLEAGRLLMTGTAAALMDDERVKRAYLG